MKTIYLVRHGETNFNAESLVQDASSLLSEKGIKQALVLAERLRHLKHEHLIVSDYTRTKQTVEPFLKYTNISPVYTPLVRETKQPTEFVGKSNRSEEYKSFLDLTDKYIFDKNWHHSDEENFFDIMKRVQNFFILISNLDGDSIVVSHGRFIRFITMYIILGGHLTPEVWLQARYNLKISNTGITMLRFDDKKEHWLLRTFNDHAHFAE